MTFKTEHVLVAIGVDLVMTTTVAVVVEAEGMGEEVPAEEGEETEMTEMTAEIAGGEEVEATIAEGLEVWTEEGLAVMVEGDPVAHPGLVATPDRKVDDEKFRRSFEIGFPLQDPVAGVTDQEVETARGIGRGDEVETAPGSGQEGDDEPGRGTGIETEGHQSLRKMPLLLTIKKR